MHGTLQSRPEPINLTIILLGTSPKPPILLSRLHPINLNSSHNITPKKGIFHAQSLTQKAMSAFVHENIGRRDSLRNSDGCI